MAEVKRFVVIGLGSFGAALAARLHHNGCRVTGLDRSQERVQNLKDCLFEAAIGNATDRATLQQLAVDRASVVFISLGEDITPSILATLHVKELGARRIIVKGVTDEHARILKNLGVERVVFPEIEIARETADRLTWPNIVDFLPIDPEYNFVEIAIPDSFAGRTLQEMNLRRERGVWVVGVKDALTQELTMFPDGQFRFGNDQLLLVVGKEADVHRLRDVR